MPPLDVVVLHNPRSGRGLASRLSVRIGDRLRERGHRVKALAVGGGEPLDPVKLGKAGAMVVIGGDGTVSRCALAAAQAGVPIYHVPTGNENLFARALGMGRSPEGVVGAVERGEVARADVGMLEGTAFLIMASVGPDAGVIRRVSRLRTRPIGHLAYAEPVLREALRPSLPRVWAEVDGVPVVDGERGILVVANTREYAGRLDPCVGASLFSGRLHVTFLPAEGTVGVLRWAAPCWRRALGGCPRVRRGEGGAVAIRVEGPEAPLQVDGEAWPRPVEGTLRARVVPGALRVLAAGRGKMGEGGAGGGRTSASGRA